jgi:hypothetical protein
MTDRTIKELTMTFTIPEILAKFKACTTEDELKKVIWKYQSPALKMMFRYVFHPNSHFSFTELPDFKPDPGPLGLSPNNLTNEMRRLYIFMDSKKIDHDKKEQLLIQLLESVHPTEAALVGCIFRHDLEIPLLTKELVQSVFPKLRLDN